MYDGTIRKYHEDKSKCKSSVHPSEISRIWHLVR